MDFNLMDPRKPTFSGGGTASPSFENAYSFSNNPNITQQTRLPLFVECFPCTSLSVLQKRESMDAMRETIFRMAVMQPVNVEADQAAPRRRNVKISKDPQSVAARHRRERISQRIRTLQRMVPGGSKMDTASMLDEAVHYLKFLKKQVEVLQHTAETNRRLTNNGYWSISNAINYANV